jgi:L,D-peptidoglycan transpeptidase YkuD (ErfK/YbiS/YcfS/YnhG family)
VTRVTSRVGKVTTRDRRAGNDGPMALSRFAAASASRTPARTARGTALVAGLAVLLSLAPAVSASARVDAGRAHPAPATTERVEPRAGSGHEASAAAASAPSAASAPATTRRRPAFATRVPARTRQVVRTVRSRHWCKRRFCTVTQAWSKGDDGRWRKVRSMRSTIGPHGFGKTREGDGRSPSGVYRIKVTFSTRKHAPGPMRWRRRLPTSNVTNAHGPLYNTWIEEGWRTDGDRPSMRYGFVVDYNNVRLRRGAGPKPVIGKGSGIFYHTSRPGQRWVSTLGCTQVGNPRAMRWIVRWLRPSAHPRVVQAL